MKRVVVAVQNMLVSEVVSQALKKRDMLVEKALTDTPYGVTTVCGVFMADVLIMDVTRFGGGSFENRAQTADMVKKSNSKIKVCFVCDNVSDEDVSFKVANARKLGRIDAFFYQSVPSDYIADVVGAM